MARVPLVNGVPNVKGRPTYYVYNPHPQLYVRQPPHPSMYPQAYAIQPAIRPTLASGMAQTVTNVTEVSETEEAVFRRLAEKIVESGPCNLFFLFKFLQPAEQRVVMQRASMKNFLSVSSHFVIDDASQSVSLADTADTRAYIERLSSAKTEAAQKSAVTGDSSVNTSVPTTASGIVITHPLSGQPVQLRENNSKSKSKISITDKSGQPVELPSSSKVKVAAPSQTSLIPTAATFVPGQNFSSKTNPGNQSSDSSLNSQASAAESNTKLQPKSLSSEWNPRKSVAQPVSTLSSNNLSDSGLRVDAPAFQTKLAGKTKTSSDGNSVINVDAQEFVPAALSHDLSLEDYVDGHTEAADLCSQTADDLSYDETIVEGDERDAVYRDACYTSTETQCCEKCGDRPGTTCDQCSLGLVARHSGQNAVEIEKLESEVKAALLLMMLTTSDANERKKVLKDASAVLAICQQQLQAKGSDDTGMSVPRIPPSLQPYHDLVKDTDHLLNICKRRSLLVNAGKGASNSGEDGESVAKDKEQKAPTSTTPLLSDRFLTPLSTTSSSSSPAVDGIQPQVTLTQQQKQQRLNTIIQALGGATAILNDPTAYALVKNYADSLSAESSLANPAAAGSLPANPVAANSILANPIAANSLLANPAAASSLLANPVAANSLLANTAAAGSLPANPLAASSSLANPLINPLAGSSSWVNPLANPLIASIPLANSFPNPLAAFTSANPLSSLSVNSNPYLQQLQSTSLLNVATLPGANNLTTNTFLPPAGLLNSASAGVGGVPQVDQPLSSGDESPSPAASQHAHSAHRSTPNKSISATSQSQLPGVKVASDSNRRRQTSESGDDTGQLGVDSARSLASNTVRRAALAAVPLVPTNRISAGRGASAVPTAAAASVEQDDDDLERWDGEDDWLSADPWKLATQKVPPLSLPQSREHEVKPVSNTVTKTTKPLAQPPASAAPQQPANVWAKKVGLAPDPNTLSSGRGKPKTVNASRSMTQNSSSSPSALSATVVNPEYKFTSLQPPGKSSIVWNDVEENVTSIRAAEPKWTSFDLSAPSPWLNVASGGRVSPVSSLDDFAEIPQSSSQQKINGHSNASSKVKSDDDQWQEVPLKAKVKKRKEGGAAKIDQSPAAPSQGKGTVPYKTVMCTHYQKGSCRNGSQCTFAHSETEMRTHKQAEKVATVEHTVATPGSGIDAVLYKTVLCNFFKKGHCASGVDCKFAHGEAELRVAQAPIVCEAFVNGHCKYGDKCVYIHPAPSSQAKRSLALGDYISKLPQTDLAASPIASSAASEDGSVSQGEDGDVGRTASSALSCAICSDAILAAHKLDRLDCGHSFHTSCIRRWLVNNRTCPMCRDHALLADEFPRLGV